MAKFEIIVGSVLGASEYVADALLETLESAGHQVTIHLEPKLEELDQSSTWIICSSTHGAGDLPENIEPFAKQIEHSDLSNLPYTIVGLGDSSYDTYCFGALTLERLMTEAKAEKIAPVIHIDVLHHPIPEDAATEWLSSWIAEYQP
ncbi:FMN-binding protein MioC [Alteromonadaceae bacterium M269]|nr:FMN-binding protein MioC [Alteromonadaceae bacterium M269]